MTMRHRTVTLLLVGTALLASAQTGLAQTPAAPPKPAPATPPKATPTAPAATPGAAATPAQPAIKLAKDQTFRMVIREPTTMDPNLAGDHSIWYVDQIFEGLYKV